MNSRVISRILITAGTFGSAVSQWVIVLVIARVAGPSEVGIFSTLLAYATPIYIVGFFALRDVYLSLEKKILWRKYLYVRLIGAMMASIIFFLVALMLHAEWKLAFSLIALKVCDAVLDIVYANIQRDGSQLTLGLLMVCNPVLSIGAVVLCSNIAGASVFVLVLVSAMGSLCTLIAGSLILLLEARFLSSPENTAVVPALRAGFPLTIAQLLSSLLTYIPLFVIRGHALDADIGKFSAVSYLIVFGNLFGSSMSTVYISQFRQVQSVDGSLVMYRQLTSVARKVVVLGLSLTVISYFAGNLIISGVYGVDFVVPNMAIVICGVAASFAAPGYLFNVGLLLMNRYRVQPFVSAVAAFTAFFGGLIMVSWGVSSIFAAGLTALIGATVRSLGLYILCQKQVSRN